MFCKPNEEPTYTFEISCESNSVQAAKLSMRVPCCDLNAAFEGPKLCFLGMCWNLILFLISPIIMI